MQNSMSFKKEKLSPIALDHFVEKHNVDTNNFGFVYITQEGRRLFFSPIDVLRNGDTSHFEYLLGQTTPYRDKFDEYPLADIAYLHTGPERSTVPWSTDPKVLQQFTQLITSLGYGSLMNGRYGLSIDVKRFVKPVIHEE